MKTGGGWAGLGAAGGTENQEGSGLPGTGRRRRRRAASWRRPPGPAGGAATLPAPGARHPAGGRPGGLLGRAAVPGLRWGPLRPGAARRGSVAAPGVHPAPPGPPPCRASACPPRPPDEGRRRPGLPGLVRRCSLRSSSRLCRRQPHCGCPRPSRPFRWKCPRAGDRDPAPSLRGGGSRHYWAGKGVRRGAGLLSRLLSPGELPGAAGLGRGVWTQPAPGGRSGAGLCCLVPAAPMREPCSVTGAGQAVGADPGSLLPWGWECQGWLLWRDPWMDSLALEWSCLAVLQVACNTVRALFVSCPLS